MRVRTKVACCGTVALAVLATAVVPSAAGAATRVSGLRLSPTTFKINTSATRPFTDATDNKTTALSFTTSSAGRLLFRVFLRVPTTGRRVNGRCVAANQSNRLKPRCTRTLLIPRGRFTYDAAQGPTNVRYQGWAQRALGAGLFRMQIEVIGNPSSKTAANFKLIR